VIDLDTLSTDILPYVKVKVQGRERERESEGVRQGKVVSVLN
jgi:hypothetical protein